MFQDWGVWWVYVDEDYKSINYEVIVHPVFWGVSSPKTKATHYAVNNRLRDVVLGISNPGGRDFDEIVKPNFVL